MRRFTGSLADLARSPGGVPREVWDQYGLSAPMDPYAPAQRPPVYGRPEIGPAPPGSMPTPPRSPMPPWERREPEYGPPQGPQQGPPDDGRGGGFEADPAPPPHMPAPTSMSNLGDLRGGGCAIRDPGDDIIDREGPTPPPTGEPPVVTPPPGTNGTNPPAWRNPPASENPASSRNAPRLVEENGQWFLTEHGRRRGPLSPSEVTAAQGYVSDFWRQFPTGFQPGQGPQTNESYPPPGSGTGGTGGGRRGWNNLGLDMPAARNRSTFEGFNHDRAMAGTDENSVKDGFFRWMQGQDIDVTSWTHAQAEEWMRAHLDDARAYGLNILEVDGDRILIETAERGPEWVDWVRGASGGNAAIWWGAAGPGGETGGPGAPGGPNTPAPGRTPAIPPHTPITPGGPSTTPLVESAPGTQSTEPYRLLAAKDSLGSLMARGSRR